MHITDNPAFQSLPADFLRTLDHALNQLSGQNDIEFVATLLLLSNETKKYNIEFDTSMQEALITHLKQKLPANKQNQFDNFLNMLRS